jgi:hypothetical protein
MHSSGMEAPMRGTSSFLLATLVVASTATAKPSQPTAKAIEPEAIDALRKMSAFLGQQKSFTIRTETETDYVLDNGQKIRLSAHGNIRVQRPSRLRAEVQSDRKNREFYYDGKTFTIYSPKVGYYARLPAPPTIGELADELQVKYGLELPLVDLFRWSGPEANFDDITAASFIGTTELDGVKTDQYAFRQQGLDWQIWIEHGNQPVPRKLVLTTTDDPARPEHAIAMTWQLGATQPESQFTFSPAKNSMQIGLAQLGAPRDEINKRAKRSARRSPGGQR